MNDQPKTTPQYLNRHGEEMPRRRRRGHLMFTAILLSASTLATAQENTIETRVTQALQTFITTWNTGNIEELRNTLHYPHVTLVGARMITANTPEEFHTDFQAMRENDGWASSSIDNIEMGLTTEDKANCLVTYSRKDADGNAYFTGNVAYIFTRKDGRWGMQFRAPIGEILPDDSQPVTKAREILDEFFKAFNAASNERLQPLSNYPHAFLLSNGRLAVAEAAENLVMNFDNMRQNEAWHKSSLDSAVVAHATQNQVHFDIVFSRQHPDGETYRTVPARWIVTNNNGHWGLQFRSLMPPTVSAD